MLSDNTLSPLITSVQHFKLIYINCKQIKMCCFFYLIHVTDNCLHSDVNTKGCACGNKQNEGLCTPLISRYVHAPTQLNDPIIILWQCWTRGTSITFQDACPLDWSLMCLVNLFFHWVAQHVSLCLNTLFACFYHKSMYCTICMVLIHDSGMVRLGYWQHTTQSLDWACKKHETY